MNANLTSAQKDLLLWHHRLLHMSLAKVRLLTQPRQWVRVSPDADAALDTTAILPTSLASTSRCKDFKCASCVMAKQHRRRSRPPSSNSNESPATLLKTNHLVPGACISCDRYVSPVRGRGLSGYGRNTVTHGYTGGALYVDHASGKIFHHPQTDLSATSTIHGKQLVEAAAREIGRTVKAYHSDNGVFSSQEFKAHCTSLGQCITFSGVGAHHQNGVAERSIQTVSKLARVNLIHLMLHWPRQCKLNLWALVMNYAVWVYNCVPRESLGGLTPDEFWSGARSNHDDLRRAHVFGCPVYVLDARLQNGKTIPKWESRSRQGMFVGFSSDHSSLVPLVLNLETGNISPQYHVIFDDKFETVPSLCPSTTEIDNTFAKLFDDGRGSSLDSFLDLADVDGALEGAPEGVSEGALDGASEGVPSGLPLGSPRGPPSPNPLSDLDADASDAQHDPSNLGLNLTNFSTTDDNDTSLPSRPCRSRHAPDWLTYTLLPLASLPLSQWAQQPSCFANIARSPTKFHPTSKVSRAHLVEQQLLHWSDVATAFTAGYNGAQLTLPWIEDQAVPDSSYTTQGARTNALITPDLSPLESPGSGMIADIASLTPLLPKLVVMLQTIHPTMRPWLVNTKLSTTELPW